LSRHITSGSIQDVNYVYFKSHVILKIKNSYLMVYLYVEHKGKRMKIPQIHDSLEHFVTEECLLIIKLEIIRFAIENQNRKQ